MDNVTNDTTTTSFNETIREEVIETPAVETTPHPVFKADRIQTVDIIRGFALLGILLMNIPIFGIDRSVYNRVIDGPHTSTDFHTMQVVYSFFDGTMRGLFSMLFGAGMILFTMNKRETPGGVTVAEYYYRRLLWLVLFGVLNAYVLLWEGDILFFYGLIGMLLYPFRNSKPKWLLIIGLSCFGVSHIKGMIDWNETRTKRAAYVEAIAAEKANKKLTEKQEGAKAEWQEIESHQKTDTARVSRNLRKMHSGYSTIFNHLLQRNSNSETWGMYHGIWDMMSMMFIGMALLGWGFFSNRLSTGSYSMWLLLGYGLGIPIGWIFFNKGWVGAQNIGPYVDAWRVPHWALYDVRRLLLSVGHASALMLLYRSGVVNWLMKALANVGQMAFTNYLMQSIICTLIFHGYGFNYYNKLAFHQLYFVVGGVWIFQIIFSAIWLRFYRFGPFEWLWRSLTYWKQQPMQLKRVEEPVPVVATA